VTDSPALVGIASLLAASPAVLAACVAIFGLVIGSFLNVVIHRLPVMIEREWRTECAPLTGADAAQDPPYNLMRPRSACPGCQAPITALQNIPLLSWLWLKGRCAHCQRPIPARYPLVELATAVLSALVAWRFGFTAHTAAVLLITWFLIPLTVIDLEHQLLPDRLTLPLLWLGLVASVALPVLRHFPVTPASAITGAGCGYLSLWLVFQAFRLVTGKEGMGYGDFKLFAALGAWLGWQQLVPVILLAAVTGALIGITLIVLRRHGRETPMPFGPYLAAAGWLVLVFAPELVAPWWPLAR
jgi:leader peptidase (prepilin peptidase) / N-methyltransferase